MLGGLLWLAAFSGLRAQADSTVWQVQVGAQATRFAYPSLELNPAESLQTSFKSGFLLGLSYSQPFLKDWLSPRWRFQIGLNFMQGGSGYHYRIDAPELVYNLRQRITTFSLEMPFSIKYQLSQNQAGSGFFLHFGGYLAAGLGGFYRRQLDVPVNETNNRFNTGFNLAGVQHVFSINQANIQEVFGSDVFPLSVFDLGIDTGPGYRWGHFSTELRFLYSLQSIDPPVAIINSSYNRLDMRHLQLRLLLRYRFGKD